MRSLHHQNIVGFIDTFECLNPSEDDGNFIYIVMELMDATLSNVIKIKGRLSETEAGRVFKSIVIGIDHLHKNNIVHFDIKPANILVNLD